MDCEVTTQEADESKNVFIEVILKHDSLFGFLLDLQDTDAGQEAARRYFERKGISAPSLEGLLPIVNMKSAVFLMFPYVSYLFQLGDSDLIPEVIPHEWLAVLLEGKQASNLTGTAKAIAIVRHSTAHFLQGGGSQLAAGNQAVDFEKLLFKADIGSIQFKQAEGYVSFYSWVRRAVKRHAHGVLKALD